MSVFCNLYRGHAARQAFMSKSSSLCNKIRPGSRSVTHTHFLCPPVSCRTEKDRRSRCIIINMVHTGDGLVRVSPSDDRQTRKHMSVTQVRPLKRARHRQSHDYASVLYPLIYERRVCTFFSPCCQWPRSATCRRL